MTERLKDGEIVGLVAKEEGIHKQKLDIKLVRVSCSEDEIKLRFPEDNWLIQTDYKSADFVGIQHTFPELATELISLKVKEPLKREGSSDEPDLNTDIIPAGQLSFSHPTSK